MTAETHFDLATLAQYGAHLPRDVGAGPRISAGPLAPVVERAVAIALSDAPRPIGVALSGGVDSTVVAAVLRQHTSISAYALDTGRAVSEAATVARRLGIPLEVLPLPAGGIRGTGPLAVARALGQPTHSGAPFGFIPLYRAMAEAGVATVFTGDGADEAFAGHAYHQAPPAAWSPAVWPTWRVVRALGVDADALLDPSNRPTPWPQSRAAHRIAAEVTAIPDSAERLRWLDLRLRQGPQCVDLQRRLATAAGLAYRAPLADAEVAGRALGHRLEPARPKRALVELAEALLQAPWRITKQPMHTPTGGQALDAGWLRWLAPAMVERFGLFRAEAVERLVAGWSPRERWLPRALVIVATTHAGLAEGVFTLDQFRGASSSK